MPRRAPARAAVAGSDRLAGLDLLRLFAALVVVFFHYGYRATMGDGLGQTAFPEIAGVAKYGFLGVDLFFVISGFVIAASAEGRSVAAFTIARAARLYPAFIVCMTMTAVVIALFGSPPLTASLQQWAANLTMVSPAFGQPFMDGAYWSIVLEIVFYGWVALFIATGLFQRRLLDIVAVWLALCALNELVLNLKPLKYLLITEYGPLFASGVLIYAIRSGERSVYAKLLLAVAFVLGAIHAFEVQAAFQRLYGDTIDIRTLWGLHAGIYGLFWLGLRWSRSLVATPLVLALGGLTYPLYLLHQNAGYVAIDNLSPVIGRWPALLLTIALMVGAAWIVWRFVEPVGRGLVKTCGTALVSVAEANWPRPSRSRAA